MACYGAPGRRSNKKVINSDYQLKKSDSVIVICQECGWLSFDYKVCMKCHFKFPADCKAKIIKQDKEIILLRCSNIKPISSSCPKVKEEIRDEPVQNIKKEKPLLRQLKRIKIETDKQSDGCFKDNILDQPKQDVKKEEPALKHQQHQIKSQTKKQNYQCSKERVLHQPKQDVKKEESAFKYQQHKIKSQTDKNLVSFRCLLKNVHPCDLHCLKEDTITDLEKYLNDTIIDVYLQYIYHKQFSQDIRERTHIFSTHFFSTIRKKWETAEEKLHIDVQSKKDWTSTNTWTKNLDLFSKDFLFIPVHKNRHWYLIVLCYLPEFIKGHYTYEQKPKPSNESVRADKLPCIYYFDSLDKVNDVSDDKLVTASYLTEFLELLWNFKNPNVKYEWKSIYIKKTNCPQQNNGYDCGIYLLHFVESFFKIPIFPSFDFSKWFSREEVKNKRSEVRNIINKLLEEKA